MVENEPSVGESGVDASARRLDSETSGGVGVDVDASDSVSDSLSESVAGDVSAVAMDSSSGMTVGGFVGDLVVEPRFARG